MEIRLLSAADRAPGRMEEIATRLRLLALLNHPGGLRLIVDACEQSPPFIAIDAANGHRSMRGELPPGSLEQPRSKSRSNSARASSPRIRSACITASCNRRGVG